MRVVITTNIRAHFSMLTFDSNQWNDLRSYYNMPDTLGMQNNLPRITHVPIQGSGQVPHETGIIVNLLPKNVHYSTLTRREFTLAKGLCMSLLKEKAENLENTRKLENDPEAAGNYIALLARDTHEYLGVIHHYQLYFKNRNSPYLIKH